MYLTKNSNNIVIKNYKDIITRYVKQIILITNGVENNNCIIFSFDEKKSFKFNRLFRQQLY